MIKACIFDLDGVIVDTAKYHYIAWRAMANELGFDFTPEQNERLKGVSRMDSLEILLNTGGIILDMKHKEELAKRKNELYLTYINNMNSNETMAGAREFLESCKRAGIPAALGSASKNAMTILTKLNLTDYFNVIIDGTHTSKAKPDPEVFLMGAEALGIDPQACVVFEDAEAGIEAALSVGMKCVGIGSQANLGRANIVISGLNQITLAELLKTFESQEK
jgi:beta-phosphoglucomutase